MRERLFRGKNRKGEWFYGCFIHTSVDAPAIIYGDGEQEEIIPETLGQYIWIKDQKGVNIFEGDKVQFIHYGKIFKQEVKFNDEIIGFDPFCTPIDYDEIYLRRDDLLIIGNIHENK